MKKFIIAAMLVMLPLSASAQGVQSPEVEARIQVLMALVAQLQEQLADLLKEEAKKKVEKRDREERCEEASEELAEAQEALDAYANETRERQRKAIVGSTAETAMYIRAKIDRERAPGHYALRDDVTEKSEAVADNCD